MLPRRIALGLLLPVLAVALGAALPARAAPDGEDDAPAPAPRQVVVPDVRRLAPAAAARRLAAAGLNVGRLFEIEVPEGWRLGVVVRQAPPPSQPTARQILPYGGEVALAVSAAKDGPKAGRPPPASWPRVATDAAPAARATAPVPPPPVAPTPRAPVAPTGPVPRARIPSPPPPPPPGGSSRPAVPPPPPPPPPPSAPVEEPAPRRIGRPPVPPPPPPPALPLGPAPTPPRDPDPAPTDEIPPTGALPESPPIAPTAPPPIAPTAPPPIAPTAPPPIAPTAPPPIAPTAPPPIAPAAPPPVALPPLPPTPPPVSPAAQPSAPPSGEQPVATGSPDAPAPAPAPDRERVPALLGLPIEDARLLAGQAEMELYVERVAGQPVGCVLRQEPSPNAGRPPGGVVRVVVASGGDFPAELAPAPHVAVEEVAVPDLLDRTEPQIRRILEALGLEPVVEPAARGPPGRVADQRPDAGAVVAKGSKVLVRIAPKRAAPPPPIAPTAPPPRAPDAPAPPPRSGSLAPVPLAPAAGTVFGPEASLAIGFTWRPVPKARAYVLEVEERTSDGTWTPNARQVARTGALVLEIQRLVAPPGPLRWRVRAVFTGGQQGSPSEWVELR